ncbi:hypothetical protein DDB_G0280663 [Dictyostelium discoideum AX4]|uniref:Uncharacterized protein n=1 Tax=Dictyostelium discoideum TaxID=44689 RepID=Q54V21_DICDI|nr:hypothetical protein DDB_G0280663 [Dictyostelium discoideum AX4]EAL67133.1 hypothetical protein DDB_G0280663 [Dictyostelium discoideum AX4]|eukprot:XP_641110.1 hypothetical protein DDB_G0280663 [Dictyostelium discoideum AX4]
MTSIHCNLVLQDGGRIISKDGSAQAQGIGNSEIIPFTTDAFITSTFPDNPPVGSPKRKTIQCIAYKYRKGPSSYTIRVSIPSISFPMGDYDGHCLGFIQPSASLGIKVRITYFGFFQFTTDTGTVKTTKNSSIMNYGG